VTQVMADKGKIGVLPFDSLDECDPVDCFDLCYVTSQTINRIRWIYHQPSAVQAIGDDLQMTVSGIVRMNTQQHNYELKIEFIKFLKFLKL
jgi:hypothetical protein